MAKIKDTKSRMKRWLANKKLNAFSVNDLEVRLKNIDTEANLVGWTVRVKEERKSILSKMWEGMRRDESTWRQKSRVKWLKEGDRNSKFFHTIANGRRKHNFISELSFDGKTLTKP